MPGKEAHASFGMAQSYRSVQFAPEPVVSLLDQSSQASESRRNSVSFRMDRDQEQMLFRNLDKKPKKIFFDPRFQDSIKAEDRKHWEHLFAASETVEGVIAGAFKGFAYQLALRYNSIAASLEEKVEGASEGLVIAIRKFDPEEGVGFMTYAEWEVRRGIIQADREKLGLSDREYKDLRKARQVREVFRTVFGRGPSPEELRQQLLANTTVSVEHIDLISVIFTTNVTTPDSIYCIDSKSNREAVSEKLANGRVDNEDEAFDRTFLKEVKDAVNAAVRRLSVGERRLIDGFIASDSEIVAPEAQNVFDRLRDDPRIQKLKDTEQPRSEPPATDENTYLKGLTEKKRAWIRKNRRRIKEVADLKRSGIPNVEIAIALGIKQSSVEAYATYARRLGLLPQRNNLNLADVKAMFEQGCTFVEIGERFHHDDLAVARFVSRHIKAGVISPHKTRSELAEDARSEATEVVKKELERITSKGKKISESLEMVDAAKPPDSSANKDSSASTVIFAVGRFLERV